MKQEAILGGLLCGNGNGLAVLDVLQADGLLRLRNGKPVWEPLETAMAEAKSLRLTGGSYTGNGLNRTVTLPVEPMLLVIWDSDSNAVLICGGGSYTCTLQSGSSYYSGTVQLQDSRLTIYNTNGTFQPVNACNVSGVTYRWLAVTEVTV